MNHSIGQKFTWASLIRYAMPSIIMMLFMSCYTIVDGVFISRYVGSVALSAVNIVFPVINLLIGLGVMLATGGSAVVASEMGRGETKKANAHFTLIVVTGVILSIFLMLLTFLFLNQFCYLLGSDQTMLPYCRDYLWIMMAFAPVCMLQCLFQSFFVTAGKPQLGLFVMITAGLVNAVLDYYFMAVLGLGIAGAALATGIGQAIPAVAGVVYFIFWRKGLHFTKFRFEGKVLLQASGNGSSEMVTNLSNAVITYAFNIIMMKLIGTSGVAAITILLYAQFLFNSIYMGFSMGVAPIFSYQFGADNMQELKRLYKISTIFVVLSSILVFVAAFFMSDLIAGIFAGKDKEVYQLTVQGFRIFLLSFLFSGFNIFLSGTFTAVSDGKRSALLSFSRTFIFILISLAVFPALLGITGVWIAVPVAEAATIIVAFLCIPKLPFVER